MRMRSTRDAGASKLIVRVYVLLMNRGQGRLGFMFCPSAKSAPAPENWTVFSVSAPIAFEAAAMTLAAFCAAMPDDVTAASVTAIRVRLSMTPPVKFNRLEMVGRLLVERVALVIEDLDVPVETAVERHAHLPRPREHLRILHRHFIADMIAIDEGIPLDQVQRSAVVITRVI